MRSTKLPKSTRSNISCSRNMQRRHFMLCSKVSTNCSAKLLKQLINYRHYACSLISSGWRVVGRHVRAFEDMCFLLLKTPTNGQPVQQVVFWMRKNEENNSVKQLWKRLLKAKRIISLC